MAVPAHGPQAGGLRAQILQQLRPEWTDQTHAKLRQVYTGYDGLPETTRLPLFFDHLFVTDVQTCGGGALPEVGGLSELRGDFLVQIDEMVDVSKPVKERLGEGASNSHMFKLLLFDGHRAVVGLEHTPIPDLHAGIPRGCKALVRGPIAVFRGCLLLTPESFVVLGGAVEELEVQRRSVVTFVSQPPVGQRGPRPALPEYMAQCRRAAVEGAAAAPPPASAQQAGAVAPAQQQQQAAPAIPQPQPQYHQAAAPVGHQPHHAQNGQLGPAAPPPQLQPPPQPPALPRHPQTAQAHGSGLTQLPGSISFGSGRVAPAQGAAQPSGAAAAAPAAAPARGPIDGWDSDDAGWSSGEEDAPLNARGATQTARHSGGAPAAAPAAAAPQPKPEPEVIDLAGEPDEIVPETEPQFEDAYEQQGQQEQGVEAWAPPAGEDDETRPLNGQPWPTGGAQARPAAVVETEPQEGPAAAAGGGGGAGGQGCPAPAAADDEIERFSQGRSPQRMISYTSGSSGKKRLRTSAGGSRRRSGSPSLLAGLKRVTPGAASAAPAAADAAGIAAGAPSALRPRPLGPALDQAAPSPAGAAGPSRPPPCSPPHYRSPEAAATARGTDTTAKKAPRGPLNFGDDDLGPPPPPLAALRAAPPPCAHPAPSGAQNNAIAAVTTPTTVVAPAAPAAPAAAAVPAVPEWGPHGPQPFTDVWSLSRHVEAAPSSAYPISATLCATVAEMVRGGGGGGGGVRVLLKDDTGAVTAAVSNSLLLDLANAASGRDGSDGTLPPFQSVKEFLAEARQGAEGAAWRRGVAAALLAHRGMKEVVVHVPGGEVEVVELLGTALTGAQIEALRARAV